MIKSVRNPIGSSVVLSDESGPKVTEIPISFLGKID